MKSKKKHDVVISGATGRFPASGDLEEFKENLFNSVDMVTEDDARWPVGKFLFFQQYFSFATEKKVSCEIIVLRFSEKK